MFDETSFEIHISRLITSGREREAEHELWQAYADFRAIETVGPLEYVLNRLAQFYSMPAAEDPTKAEACFLECETLSPRLYPRLQTATFYFYVSRDFTKTIEKINEMKALRETVDSPSYYSALSLKGQALIELDRDGEAGQVLEEMLVMLQSSPSGLPYGDELNFLGAAICNPLLAPSARAALELLVPRMRSPEYAEKARALIKSV